MSDDFTLDGVEPGSDYDDLPIGSYVCYIEDCVQGHAKTGTPELRVQFKVVMGEQKGKVVSDWLYFTNAAAGLILTKITAAQVDAPTGIKGGEAYAKALAPLLHGQHVEVVIRPDTYNGETRNKVKAWKKPPADLQVAASVNGTVSAPSDDDIPF